MTRKDIYKAIKEWLDGNKWHYECASNSSILYMGVGLKSEINKLRVIVDVRNDFFLVYAIIGIGGANNLLELIKFLTMANYGLINGNFEIDVSDCESMRIQIDNIPTEFSGYEMTDNLIGLSAELETK